jgi:Fe(3+) dicitrate transport protein
MSRGKHRNLFFLILALYLNNHAFAQAQEPAELTHDKVVVTAPKVHSNSLPAIEGTKIYEGKKATLIDLSDSPRIINNNYRQALEKTPGLLLSEETTPLVSIGYRGLDPHRSQFTQVLKDGIPITADIVGYPEAYYTPALQSIDHIDFIRGGASLLYGPQPGGALNYVTKDPYEYGAFQLTTENSFGSNDLFSNYTSISGTEKNLGYYAYIHHRQTQGFRDFNSQSSLFSGGTKFRVKQNDNAHYAFTFDAYEEEHGEPGGLTRADFDSNIHKTNRLNDRLELNRYAGSLQYTKNVDDQNVVEAKAFGGVYERLSWRQRTSAASNFGTAPSGTNSTSNDIEDQRFYTGGGDVRVRRHYEGWGADENILTSGVTLYHSTSPRIDKRGSSADSEDGTIRKDADRDANYVAVFMENLFKWGKFSLTPGVRLENIWQHIQENINLDKTNVPLAEERDYEFAPLVGLGTQYELTDTLDLYGNVSQSYRPKIYTQAVPTSNGQTVNQDLDPGSSWQAEIGARGEPTSYFSWDTSLFLMDFNDQIGTVGSTGAVVQNVGDATHQGVEVATNLDVIGSWDALFDTDMASKAGSLDFFNNVMVLKAEFTGGPNENKAPQYAPDYIYKTGLQYAYFDKAKIRLAGTFVADHFANDSNSTSFIVPSYKIWDLTTEVMLCKNASLFGGINNLFDEHYYTRVRSDGIDPSDGRNYYAGLKLDW